jgi:hypothetical protein
VSFALLLAASVALVRRRGAMVCVAATLACAVSNTSANTVDFEDFTLSPNSFYNGADAAGDFESRGVTFDNVYDAQWQSWYGFAASNVNDTTTPGYGNQYAAITGSGVGGAGNYGVGFDPTGGQYGSPPRIDLNHTAIVGGLFVTNITYTYLAVADGDDGNTTPFVRQFGDDPAITGGANQGYADHLLLRITGHDASDAPVGSVDFYLADYRLADNADDYVVDSWRWVDLSSLGAVASLSFAVASTDNSFGYINTPAYFAIDNLTIAPEPATTAGLLLATTLWLCRQRRCRGH